QLLGVHVLPCEMPDGMEYLGLKAVEGIFYGLGLPVVRHCGAMKHREALEEACGITFFMSALIVGHDLVGTAAGNFHGHAICPVLAVKILIRGYVIAQQGFAV